MKHTRRDFIKASIGASATAGVSTFAALPVGRTTAAATPRLETFSDWIRADRDTRKRGLEQCLQRIRELDPMVHAWVQVKPERPTANGPLSEIPFGVKDIVETQGMATEYGSPLYKGRVGTTDRASRLGIRRTRAPLPFANEHRAFREFGGRGPSPLLR